MTTEPLPTGPNPEAITRTIRETWPETDRRRSAWRHVLLARREKHWPNFATIVTTDEHDEGAPSNWRDRASSA